MRKNGKTLPIWQQAILILTLIAFTCVSTVTFAAPDTVCAEVKISIQQKLSFERQAFDARMAISNGLTDDALENINIELLFFDRNNQPVVATQDPNATDALFFYRTDSSSGIDGWDGSGRIAENTEAEIHWLIIPTAGAAGSELMGKIYYVGAKITYTLKDETQTVEVTPDFIRVKPLPELTLDYFLPRDVYGDDPFTPEVEPMIPFTLGVRIKNSGFATSAKTQIESAQVKIVENKQDLLINFKILASYVANLPVNNSLTLDFGDILPDSSKVGRWLMTASLSGQFTEFKATFTHADSLGGALTSVLKAVNTHQLVHDVKVDLLGRDDVLDFLALDGDVLRVYESEGIDTIVKDQSENAQLIQHSPERSEINFPSTPGFVYAKINDPWSGKGTVDNVQRADGKALAKENVWRSQTRNDDMSWSYFINLFDVDSVGQYAFDYTKEKPPVTVLRGNVCDSASKYCVDNLTVTLTMLYEENGQILPIETHSTVTYNQGNYEFSYIEPGLYTLEIEPLVTSLTSDKEGKEYKFNSRFNESIKFYVKDDLSIEVISPKSVSLTSEAQ